ncbi:hypothetical protein ACWA1C_19555 [Flectobacillus roseus]
MTKKYLIDGIKKVMKPYLDEHGITIKQNGSIVKSDDDLRCQIMFNFNNYGTIEIQAVFTVLRYNHLEKAVIDIVYNGGVDIVTLQPYSAKYIKERYEFIETMRGPLFKGEVVEFFVDEQIDLLAEFLIEFMEQKVKPFCEKYPDIYSIGPEFYKYDPPYQEGVGYVGLFEEYLGNLNKYQGDYTSWIIRRLLLLKFTADPKYDDYMKWIQECRDTGQIFPYLHNFIDKVIAYPIPTFYLK